jgi:DNA (cytosine-5)-methyltransferase 1
MKVLDLCCGAGGLSRGFEKAGFNVSGVDISEKAVDTYNLNNKGKSIKADLLKELIETNADLIIGGPSCRPWSAVNLTRRGTKHKDYRLMTRFFRHIEMNKPLIFMMENVPLVANDRMLLRNIKGLQNKGYSIIGKRIKYSDFGASTKRRRLVLFGIQSANANIFFDKLSKLTRPPTPIQDIMWYLREKGKGEVADHIWPDLKTIEKYRHYYETGKYGWYILKWKEPAPSFGNVMKTYTLHPDSFDSAPARVISVKESLLIMGYDSSFRFPDHIGMGARYQMTVDSVNPLFSYLAARVIKEIIKELK